jgi:hypothetical protein
MNKIENMIEVIPKVDVKVINETLSRIGIANKQDKVLYPSCYLFQNFEKCYIVHFKELFALTRANAYLNISEDDISRKNSIICRLAVWDLIEIVNYEDLQTCDDFVYILSYKEKTENDWKIIHKFNINSLTTVE